MWSFLCIFAAFCSTSFVQGQNADPVKVTVYYESLCPDSIRFFTKQLEPTYNELSNIMTVELHAYGKAKNVHRPKNNGYLFRCQHGSDECYGNKVLGCGQQHIKDHDTYLSFAFCLMGSDYPPNYGEQCAARVGVDYSEISQCLSSSESEIILHDVGTLQSQLNPQLYYVPWILINDEFSEENLDAAQYDLKSLVCSMYEDVLPQECFN